MGYFNNLPALPTENDELQQVVTNKNKINQPQKESDYKPDLVLVKQGVTDYSEIVNAPTKLSQFEDDLGENPVHSHAQYALDVDLQELLTALGNVLVIDGGTATEVVQ